MSIFTHELEKQYFKRSQANHYGGAVRERRNEKTVGKPHSSLPSPISTIITSTIIQQASVLWSLNEKVEFILIFRVEGKNLGMAKDSKIQIVAKD